MLDQEHNVLIMNRMTFATSTLRLFEHCSLRQRLNSLLYDPIYSNVHCADSLMQMTPGGSTKWRDRAGRLQVYHCLQNALTNGRLIEATCVENHVQISLH